MFMQPGLAVQYTECANLPESSNTQVICQVASSQFLPREATRSAVLLRQVVRLSVRPSVTLGYRDHIGWNSWKIISRLISLTISLSGDPNMTEAHPKF